MFKDGADVLRTRCGQCHALGEKADEQGRPLPSHSYGHHRGSVGRPTGAFERIVFENDPIARYSANILLNFSRPALSSLLLGPLSKKAGGYASCGEIFKGTGDSDYQRLLGLIEKAKSALDEEPRYATPTFKPNRQYIREMKKFGILPPQFDLAKDPIDVFELDQAYWRAAWYSPDGH